MNRLSALSLTLALALPSCGGAIPKAPKYPEDGRLVVRIDQNFGPTRVEAIVSGITRWYSAAGICLDIQIVNVDEEYETWGDDGVTTIYYGGDGTWPKAVFDYINGRDGVNNAIGLTLFPMKDIFLTDEYYSLRQVAMHEMGHVLGIMEHSSNRLSTMYWIALSGGLQDVTHSDAALAAKLNPGHRCR
jgi:hypothetical protein